MASCENKYTTLLDLSRQAKIITGNTACFDGKIQAGIPFSGYPTGVDISTMTLINTEPGLFAVFSGNNITTEFDLANPASPTYNPIFSSYTTSGYTWSGNTLYTTNVSGLTTPITPFSAQTQIVGPIWTLTQTGRTGDHIIATEYTGYTITYNFFSVSGDLSGSSTSIYSGVTGLTSAQQINYSAGSRDYKGPVDYLRSRDDATIDNKLITNKLRVIGGASGSTIGYVLKQIDSEGNAGWRPDASGSTPSSDVFVFSGDANAALSTLSFLNTTGGTFTVTNSAALFADNDINVTGGTYNNTSGCVTFVTNSGTSFDICGFLTGFTDTFVSGGTYGSGTLTLNRNDGTNINISGFSETNDFTGNTSGNCINEIWVSNISGCTGEDLHIGVQHGQDIYFDSTGTTTDPSLFINSKGQIGVGTNSPFSWATNDGTGIEIHNDSINNQIPIAITEIGTRRFFIETDFATTSNPIHFKGSSSTNLMTFYTSAASARVGIGTTVPEGSVQIAKAGTVANQVKYPDETNIVINNTSSSYTGTSGEINSAAFRFDHETTEVVGGLITSKRRDTWDSGEKSTSFEIWNNSGETLFKRIEILPDWNTNIYGDINIKQGGVFYTTLDLVSGPWARVSGTSTDLIQIGATEDGIQGISVGARGSNDATWTGYGKPKDGFIYSSAEQNGLNIISAPTAIAGSTEDYIRFYAGQSAIPINTPDMIILGTGATRGYVGINTENPTEKLHIEGTVRIVDGTEQAGYVFTSDATGVGSWQALSGGSANTFVTGGTINSDGILLLNWNNGGFTNPIDLSSLIFTGNTSGDCISDLWVSNIHSCSPLNINSNDEGNVYYGSTSGVTIDVINSRIGIGTASPTEKITIDGGDMSLTHDGNQNSRIVINNSGTGVESRSSFSLTAMGLGGVETSGTLTYIGENYNSAGTFQGSYLPNSLNLTTGGGGPDDRAHLNIGSRSSTGETRFFGGGDNFEDSKLIGIFYTSGLTISDDKFINTENIIIRNGSNDGYVLTSDASGVGTWQPSSGGSFTGNTSGDCISDLWVSNIHSCSPLNINAGDEGNVYYGSTSGITLDVINSRIGIGVDSPSFPLHISSSTQVEVKIESSSNNAFLTLSSSDGTNSYIDYEKNGGDRWIVGTHGGDNDKFKWATGTTFGSDTVMTITKDGELGIGTTTPEEKLDIKGNLISTTSNGVFQTQLDNAAGPQIRLSGGSSGLPRITVLDGLNSSSISMGARAFTDVTYPGYGNPGDGFLYSSDAQNGLNILSTPGAGSEDYIRFYAGNDANGHTPSMQITGVGANKGNVGINTINPLYPLHVNGDGFFNETITLSSTTVSADPTIIFDNPGASNQLARIRTNSIGGGTSGEFYIDTADSGVMENRIRIDQSGGIGIGVTSLPLTFPAKLTVQGNISGSSKTITNTIQIQNGANVGYVLTSDVDGNGTWSPSSGSTSGYWEVGGEGNSLYDNKGSHILTGSSRFSMIAGGETNRITSHDSSGIFVGKDNVLTGSSIFSEIQNAIIGGQDNTISSLNGYMTNCLILGGDNNSMTGRVNNGAIIGGANHSINSTLNDSIIIGGNSNSVSGSRNVVLGGANMTGITGNDTVFVPKLNIRDVSNGTPTMNLGVDSNGLVVSAATGSDSGNCITELWVTNLESCSPLHINTQNQGDIYFGDQGGGAPLVTLDITTPNEPGMYFGEESFIRYNETQKELIIGEDEAGGKVKIKVDGDEILEVDPTTTRIKQGDLEAEEGNIVIKSGNSKSVIIEDIPDVGGANLGTDVDGKLIDIPSDSRVKHNITEINNIVDPLKLIQNVKAYQFEFLPETRISRAGKKHYGFKVDDFRDDLILGKSDLTPEEENINNIARTFVKKCNTKFNIAQTTQLEVDAMNYIDLIPFMIESIKQLDNNINNINSGSSNKFVTTQTLNLGQNIITHNLNDENVIVQVIEVSTGQLIIPDRVSRYLPNSVAINVEQGGEYKIIIIS